MASLAKAGALGASAFAPLALRTLDGRNKSLTRPSVLVPSLLGTTLGVAGFLVNNGTISAPVGSRSQFSQLAMESGLVMLGGAAGNVAVDSGVL